MARRLSLPLLSDLDDEPTVEAMRRKLGGLAPTGTIHAEFPLGSVVLIDGHQIGVLLSADDTRAHVYLDKGLVKVTPRSAVALHPGTASEHFEALSAQVRFFVELMVTDRVAVEVSKGQVEEADLVEKCRFGAIVGTSDGRLLAVGFGKLWPVAKPEGN